MDSTIRRLTENDLEIWKEIRLEALKKHPIAFIMSYEEEVLYSDDKWHEILRENHVFGAFDRDKIVACGAFCISTPNKIAHRATFWGMYVRPEKRGSGVSKQVVETIVENASKHVIQLHCSVVACNGPAIKLYKNCGFKIYGTEPRYIRVGDHFYDEHMMVLLF